MKIELLFFNKIINNILKINDKKSTLSLHRGVY